LPKGNYLLPSFAPSSLNDHAGGLNGGQVYSNASFSFPSTFNEDQYVIDLDHQISARQTIAGKFFSAGQTIQSPAGNVPGFVFTTLPQNTNSSLVHTFILSPTFLNEARVGYVRITNEEVLVGGADFARSPEADNALASWRRAIGPIGSFSTIPG
jgi:hypothetical protein